MRLGLLSLPAALCAPFAIAQSPPPQAVAAGYTNLVFDDEFNSPNTVSPDGTANYSWYLTNFTNPALSLTGTGYGIDDGILTILTDNSGYSDGLQTADPLNTTQDLAACLLRSKYSLLPILQYGSGVAGFLGNFH